MGLLIGVAGSLLASVPKPPFSARSSAPGWEWDPVWLLMWRSRLLPRPLVMFADRLLAFLGGIGVLLGAWDNPSGALIALTPPPPPRCLRSILGILVECLAAH